MTSETILEEISQLETDTRGAIGAILYTSVEVSPTLGS
jgi:hypothetical protein